MYLCIPKTDDEYRYIWGGEIGKFVIIKDGSRSDADILPSDFCDCLVISRTDATTENVNLTKSLVAALKASIPLHIWCHLGGVNSLDIGTTRETIKSNLRVNHILTLVVGRFTVNPYSATTKAKWDKAVMSVAAKVRTNNCESVVTSLNAAWKDANNYYDVVRPLLYKVDLALHLAILNEIVTSMHKDNHELRQLLSCQAIDVELTLEETISEAWALSLMER